MVLILSRYPERSTLASMVAAGPSKPRHPSFMYRSREGPSEESPQTSPDSLGSPELSPGTSFSPSNSNLPAPGYHQVYRPNDMYSPPSTKISNRLPSSRVLSGKSTRGPRSGPREREESGNLTPIQRRTVFEMDPFLQYEGTWIREHDEDGREVLRAVLGTEIWICKACGKNVGGDNRHATTPAPWKAHRNGDGSRKNACKAIIFYKEKAFAEFKQPNSEYYDLFRDYDSWDDPNLEDCLWSGDWLSYVKEIAPNEDGTAKTHHPSPRKEPIWLKFSRLAAQLPPDPQLEKKDNGHVFWKDARYTVGDYTRSLRGFRAPENHAYSFVGGP
ncbi:hypothetical protein DL96DRAFT_852560 [Flagelloscypha sp. PMI_526]|nr:hypothetical protein DL96DRAFT_852560 [Flagelloscypha sp. PMI_526]